MRPRSLLATAVLALVAGAPHADLPPLPEAQSVTGLDSVASVPFGPGELAKYRVRLGGVRVGSGSMHIVGMETVRGHQTYRARFRLAGGIPFARVDNTLESWIDVEGLFARRYFQDQKEVRFERTRTFEFYPERRMYYRVESGETGDLATDRPLDEVSFLYHVRTMRLEVGRTYTLDRYYQESGNPVILQVVRRERITVPAGTFDTIVVRPVIQTSGLFAEGGEAEVYFTDDDRRLLVQLSSRVPVVGSLTMQLEEYQAGRRYAERR